MPSAVRWLMGKPQLLRRVPPLTLELIVLAVGLLACAACVESGGDSVFADNADDSVEANGDDELGEAEDAIVCARPAPDVTCTDANCRSPYEGNNAACSFSAARGRQTSGSPYASIAGVAVFDGPCDPTMRVELSVWGQNCSSTSTGETCGPVIDLGTHVGSSCQTRTDCPDWACGLNSNVTVEVIDPAIKSYNRVTVGARGRKGSNWGAKTAAEVCKSGTECHIVD
jgi:hypothetical protein